MRDDQGRHGDKKNLDHQATQVILAFGFIPWKCQEQSCLFFFLLKG